MQTSFVSTTAASDSGESTGIQADLKKRSVSCTSAITAITVQSTTGVCGVEATKPAMVPEQITAVQEDVPPRAVKIGMLTSAGIDAGALGAFDGPVVLDPVMVAKSDNAFSDEEAGAVLIERILPRANVLTPNRPEAARLLGRGEARDTKESRVLLAMGPRAALVKGGDAATPIFIDRLVTGADVIELEQPRIATRNTHGTGHCLSTAISAELATRAGQGVAVRRARALLHVAIRAADGLGIRRGHGHVHHFHGLWS